MGSVSEVIEGIINCYKGKENAPIVSVVRRYFLPPGCSYDINSGSITFGSESRTISDLENLEALDVLVLPVTSLAISLFYGEEIGSVIFRVPASRGGAMIIDVLNIEESHRERVLGELEEICEELHYKLTDIEGMRR